jgi:hypothetical protein
MGKSKSRNSYRGFREFYDEYDDLVPKKKRLNSKRKNKTKIREKLEQIDINNLDDDRLEDLEDFE